MCELSESAGSEKAEGQECEKGRVGRHEESMSEGEGGQEELKVAGVRQRAEQVRRASSMKPEASEVLQKAALVALIKPLLIKAPSLF